MNPETPITLQVQDDETQVVQTTLKAAQQSLLLKGMFEEMNEVTVDLTGIPIYAQDVSLVNLQRAVAFMERRAETPMKEIQQPLFMSLRDCVDEEDFQTVAELDYYELGRLLSLASYLNIPDLVGLIGARLAEKIRDITPEQLAQELGVNYRDVISEEEEEAVRKRVEESLAQYAD